MSDKTEWAATMGRKLENIISGHRINADDADWLRGLLSKAAPQPPAEAQAQGGGEVFGWVLGDAFVDARFWTAGTPPQGWTPVYRTAPPSAPVGVVSAADAVMAVPELQDMACIGSMSPAEHALGLLQQALAQKPAPVAPVGVERLVSNAIAYGKRLQWPAVMATLERLRGTLALAQQPAAVDIEELRRALCVIGVVGTIDGYDVIRRESMLDIIDRRRSALAAKPEATP